MQITTDKDGYLINYVTVGELADSKEIDTSIIQEGHLLKETDEDGFEIVRLKEEPQFYKLENDKIVFIDERKKQSENELQIQELRQRREVECFSIINRGKLWYELLSDNEIQTLNEWYLAWLRVTVTLRVPRRPKFLSERSKI